MSSPLRRHSDEDQEADYRQLRARGGLDAHTKWVVGAFGTLVLGSITTLVAWTHEASERKNKEQDDRITAVEQLARTLAIQQAGTDARWEEIKRTMSRIEGDLKDLKRR